LRRQVRPEQLGQKRRELLAAFYPATLAEKPAKTHAETFTSQLAALHGSSLV
jgi:hypothetical protein